MRGPGGILSFVLDEDAAATAAVVDRLRLFSIAASLGGVESLVTQPITTTHHGLTAEERARRGIVDGMVRLSVGLEDADDLVADLRQALGESSMNRTDLPRLQRQHAASPRRCRAAMLPYLSEHYGNPSSTHWAGAPAAEAVARARGQVAGLLGCSPAEVVFTSGGTEANNTALTGVVEASGRERPHLIVSAVEHPAILEPCHYLERHGAAVTYLPVDGSGLVDPGDVGRGDPPRDGAGLGHARQQRGGHHRAHRRDCEGRARGRSPVAQRRRPVGRQGRDDCG